MKKLHLLLMTMLLAICVSAQSPTAYGIRVENHTPCTIYYQVFGSEPCMCAPLSYTSTMIAIAPTTTTMYPSSILLPGFPAMPKGIVGARIYHGPMACMTNFGIVGQPPCGLALNYIFQALNISCSLCTNARAQWIPATSCEDIAILRFTIL